MTKLYKLAGIAIIILIVSVGFAFMSGDVFGTPKFASSVAETFISVASFTFIAMLFLDIDLDDE